MRSLSIKLIAAFALAALVGIVLAGFLIDRSTTSQFQRYLAHSESAGGMMGRGMGAMMQAMMGLPERSFLREVQNSLLIAGASAVAVSVLLGMILVRQIVAPLRRVTVAAQHIARGDLSLRVPASSSDEVGKLALSFNAMADSLARNQELRRNLMADIAHELRTPLTVIQSNIEAMLDDVIEPDKRTLSSLHEEATLLARLITDLRTLSLVEAGQLELHPAATDLRLVLERAVSAIKTQADQRHISLTLEAPPQLPPAMVDGDRIAQVLANLLGNALRYTPEDGTITVKAAHDMPGYNLVVFVSDTRPGIAPADLPHIFERFYRAQRGPARSGTGSGIGLAIVKKLVESSGGQVWAESELGKGSTFFFSLPLSQQPATT